MRKDAHQGLADEFGIRVGKRFIGDFPDLTVGSAESGGNRIKIGAPTRHNGRKGSGRIDVSCRGREFQRGIIGRAIPVFDVGEDPSHYCNPPWAFSNSMSSLMFCSLLPFSTSAPLPSAGTK